MQVRKFWPLVGCLGLLGLTLSGCGTSAENSTADAGKEPPPGVEASDAASEIDSTTGGPRLTAQPVTAGTPGPSLGGQPLDENSPSGQLESDEEVMEFDEEVDFEDGIKDLAESEVTSPELNPEEGTPEWLVREIVKTLSEPLPETDKTEEITKEQIARNRKVVSLARQAVEKIHDDPSKSRVFDVAIHRLIDSQAALALLGDSEGTDGLYDSAKSLYARDPKSRVAIDATFMLVNLAFTNAHRTAGRDDRWVKEYARLSRMFVTYFPEDSRGVSMLYNSALGCEWNGLAEDAGKTYALLVKKFPDTPQGKLVPGVERRLKLVGEPLTLTGPSLETGEELKFTSEPGQVAAVIFWSADSEECRRVLPIANRLSEENPSLKLVGVCVDSDRKKAAAFAKELGLKWPQIFYTEAESTGWKNPIVKKYSVMDVSAWLVSADGTVADTSTSLGSLEQHLSSLLKRGASREK